MSGLRSLPTRVDPLPGEAIDSWLEAVSRQLRTPWNDLLPALGLSVHRHPQRHPTWVSMLRAEEAAGLSAATEVELARLRQMTLAYYDGRALNVDPVTCIVNTRQLWARSRGSRFCPDCLQTNGGRWLLSWRLGWSFVCLIHRRILGDLCPACGQHQRMQPAPASQVAALGLCMNSQAGQARTRGRSAHRCGHPLANTQAVYLSDSHPALSAQEMVMQIIDRNVAEMGVYAAHPQTAITALADIKSIASRVINRATRQQLGALLPDDLVELAAPLLPAELPRGSRAFVREGGLAPRRAALAAVSLTVATQIMAQPDVRTAGEALRWLIAVYHPKKPPPPATLRAWSEKCSPVLDGILLSALEPTMMRHGALRYRIGARLPGPPMSIAWGGGRTRALPSMSWIKLALRLFLPKAGLNLRTVQAALPCIVLQIGTTLSHRRAAELLTSFNSWVNNDRVLRALQKDSHWADIEQVLLRLSDHLDHHTPPIDYQRRRQLDYADLLPPEDWPRFCRAAEVSVGRGPRYRATRCYLFERLSSMPAERAPEAFAASTSALRQGVVAFPTTLTPGFVAELERTAQTFLASRGIDEPTTWQPPDWLFDGLVLPGHDPADIEVQSVHRLMREEGLTASQTASRLSTSSHVIVHLLEDNPLPQNQWQARIAGLAREDLKQRLPQQELARLRLLYSESEIARRFNTSNQMVRKIRIEYGLPGPRQGNGSVRDRSLPVPGPDTGSRLAGD